MSSKERTYTAACSTACSTPSTSPYRSQTSGSDPATRPAGWLAGRSPVGDDVTHVCTECTVCTFCTFCTCAVLCCAVLCFAIHAVTYIWLCEHLYLTLRAYSSRASYSRNLPHQNTAQHKYSTSVILSSSRHHSHRQHRDTNLSLTTLHHRRAVSLGHGLVRPWKMVRRRKELRLWHRVRPAALRETTQPKRRTATLQQGRRVSQLCRASERAIQTSRAIFPALQRCGTVQYSRVHRNTSRAMANQPASRHIQTVQTIPGTTTLSTSPRDKARSGRRRIKWGFKAPVQSRPAPSQPRPALCALLAQD